MTVTLPVMPCMSGAMLLACRIGNISFCLGKEGRPMRSSCCLCDQSVQYLNQMPFVMKCNVTVLSLKSLSILILPGLLHF